MSVNKVIIIGHIGQQPELKYTQSGQAVCNLRIATNEVWNDKQGNKQERTEWHTVVLFGKNAETASQYLEKGRQVYIEGKIQTRKWQGKDGSDHYSTEIIADDMRFIGESKGDSKTSAVSNKHQDRIDFVNTEKAKRAQQTTVGKMMQESGLIEEEQFPF